MTILDSLWSLLQVRKAIELFTCFCFHCWNLVIKISQGGSAQWHMNQEQKRPSCL